MRTILLDGWCGWPRRLAAFQNSLARLGLAPEVFEYEASGFTPLEALGERLAKRVREGRGPVNLIGFSMGGIVARTARLLDPSLPIHRAAFIHSPHYGSLLAHLLPFLPAMRQMRLNSGFLRRLNEVPWPEPTLCVWCPGDLMVVPGASARWNGAAEHLRCDVPAHVWPLFSRTIQERVARFLAA